jgi:ribosomal-protein-alanine N-acetyltransferase
MVELQTKRLLIREMSKRDIPALTKHLNNLDITRNLLLVGHPHTEKHTKAYIAYTLKASKQRQRTLYEFGISKEETPDMLIGAISLSGVSHFDRTAKIGYWLAPEEQNKGYMTEALNEMIRFAFEDLELNRINSSAFSFNASSNHLLKKVGFTLEGESKEYCRVLSTREIVDGNFYGLLQKDWKKS